MNFRVRQQIAEAMGSVNRWFCSQMYGYEVNDPDLLLTYFVKSGGARNFEIRYSEAMSDDNRWYCSQFYNRPIRDPEILWNYYVTSSPMNCISKHPAPSRHDERFDQSRRAVSQC